MFFYLTLTDFQNFPGPVALFQDFPVLEIATIKFQDFPGFPGPVQTLCLKKLKQVSSNLGSTVLMRFVKLLHAHCKCISSLVAEWMPNWQ